VQHLTGCAVLHFKVEAALWWATVTALTIGYGDLAPVTTIGRAAGVVFGHFWIFVVIPMIVANIILHLVEDHNAFTHDEQVELLHRIKSVELLLGESLKKQNRGFPSES
jgi:hypothetical protein